MSPKDPSREKRVWKDTPGVSQYRKAIELGKKRQEESQRRKLLKEQGVGSTIPASRKSAAQAAREGEEESLDEDFDAVLAEAKLKEAWTDALRAKLAKRDRLKYKRLKTLDEPKLQRLWDEGKTAQAEKQTLASENSKRGTLKVQPTGPSQQILASSTPATGKGNSAKRKRTSSSTQATTPKSGTKSQGDRQEATDTKHKPNDMKESDSDGESDSEQDTEDGHSDVDAKDNNNDNIKPKIESARAKGARGKTSDFTGTVKKMVDYVTVCTCAKLTTTGMFCLPRKYKVIVSKAWLQATLQYGVNAESSKYKLRKAHKQAIRARVNSFRSRIRDRLKPAVTSVYKLLGEGLTLEEAKERVAALFPHKYHTKVGAPPKTGHFQHSFIKEAIFEAYYTGNNPIGDVYNKWFDPMPLEAIALVCAIIRWVIQQHETGKYVKAKMSFNALQEYYNEAMDSLRAFHDGIQAQRCAVLRRTLYLRCMERAGLSVQKDEPKLADTTLGEADFAEDIPTAEELKLLAHGSLQDPVLAQDRSNKTPRSVATTSNTPPGLNNSQRSSLPPSLPPQQFPVDNTANIRQQSSSVSLDHEEPDNEPDASPTPTIQPRPTTANKPHKDSNAEEDSEDDKSDADSDNEATQSQTPQKKQKTTPKPSFVEKLTGSSWKVRKLSEY